MSFTIITGKEGTTPKGPVFLVTIVAPDGDTTYLTTRASYGAANIVYGGHTYMARILNNEIQPIQAMSPQGFDTVPGFTMTLADADKNLWTNHCVPHGWRGAQVTLTAILWDAVANTYSTDAIQWTFIGGNPQHNHAQGQTTLDVTSANNFTRLKVPTIPLEYRCPWDFPPPGPAGDPGLNRRNALNDPTSIYYQCGYSPDQTGGVGNYKTGTTPFTTCDLTRSGGRTGASTTDPSVGCMARLGNAATTSVAPDGDLEHDKGGHYTARFGGVTFQVPTSYGLRFLGQTQKSNQANTALAGSFYNWVYGTQWVPAQVLSPGADANSLRSEVALCVSAFGVVSVLKVIVNGIELTRDNAANPLMTWRFNGGTGSTSGAGGRSGKLCTDAYFKSLAYSALGDPHGSVAVLEFVSPLTVAAGGSIPNVQVLVTSGPMLTVNAGGSFVYAAPNLTDSDGIAGPAANPVFTYLDLMTWGNISTAQINPMPWYNSAQICATAINYTAADGSTKSHAQFKTSFQLSGNSRQPLAAVLVAIRNSANMMVGQNPLTGLFECWIKRTLADQQPSVVSGSNDTTARSSPHADSTVGTPDIGTGYYAYFFNESNIEAGSFKISATRIESTPNTVGYVFQDERNGYQQDSLTQIDPASYAYSGNQEINVPVPMVGIPNFDQATRQANVQLGEALFGNPRGDAGGTLYFEFSVNHRVIHLANQLGYICGLTWTELSIGVSAPQAVRILSLKPDTDGEHWQVKCAWHNDVWYTYAYGQNPTPYRFNPLTAPQIRPPYPWRPGQTVWGAGDALFPGQLGFLFDVDTTQYPALININGAVPVNTPPATSLVAPLVPLQATTANTGGSIPPGNYLIQLSSNGVLGPVSVTVTANVPTGTSTNTITVSGVDWRGTTAPSIKPFIGRSSMEMRACAGADYSSSTADANGNPTVYVFTAYTVDGLGLPDSKFSEFLVEETGIKHGGVWGDAITSVAGAVLTFAAGAWSANQWQTYVLSLYYRPGLAVGTAQPALNLTVSSSTATTLTMAATGFLPGDVVVMRAQSGNFGTAHNTIGDANFANSYAALGLKVNGDVGNLILIIKGTGAWQPPISIASNTATVHTINGTWAVDPDATSIYIVITPGLAYSYYTQAFTASASGVSLIATTPAITSQAQSLLVTVFACDADGNASPMSYQPSREVYIPAQGGPGSAIAPNNVTIVSAVVDPIPTLDPGVLTS